MRPFCLLACLAIAGCADSLGPTFDQAVPPRPDARYESPAIPAVGAVPLPHQLAWQDREVHALVHIGVNTFTGREWGTGGESPRVFRPSALGASQWADAARAGGVAGLILTAKHHDGFALYPTRHSDHSVAQSPWRGGQGDLVRETADAARAAGLAFGVYLSPWDRHEPTWGTAAYNDFYTAQLAELTDPAVGADYGDLFELWLDGAHGEEVTEAQRAVYDWAGWRDQIGRAQPSALVAFGPELRYGGNERGVGPETHWHPLDGRWSPIECVAPFRAGWFWHPDDGPKSLDALMDIYFASVGRDCTLLIGLAPDRRGLLEREDVDRLREWREAVDRLFATDLAAEAPAIASSTRPGSAGWAAGAATDGDPASFWASADTSAWVETDLGVPLTANVVEIREPVRFGQRIAAFRVEALVKGSWQTVARGTTVGRRRLLRFAPAEAQRWRLVVEDARGAPAVAQFSLYGGPSGR